MNITSNFTTSNLSFSSMPINDGGVKLTVFGNTIIHGWEYSWTICLLSIIIIGLIGWCAWLTHRLSDKKGKEPIS